VDRAWQHLVPEARHLHAFLASTST
jgi:hypothetical protein